jgi:hypothetical protein
VKERRPKLYSQTEFEMNTQGVANPEDLFAVGVELGFEKAKAGNLYNRGYAAGYDDAEEEISKLKKVIELYREALSLTSSADPASSEPSS